MTGFLSWKKKIKNAFSVITGINAFKINTSSFTLSPPPKKSRERNNPKKKSLAKGNWYWCLLRSVGTAQDSETDTHKRGGLGEQSTEEEEKKGENRITVGRTRTTAGKAECCFFFPLFLSNSLSLSLSPFLARRLSSSPRSFP